jgi:hypothetical protein
MLVPSRPANLLHPSYHPDVGALLSTNIQAYHWFMFEAEFPQVPMISGPRGRAHIACPTDVKPGNGGSTWVSDPWRVMHVDATGHVTTLVGYDEDVGLYWERRDQPSPHRRVVGDWSQVAGPHALWGCWGWDWDRRTVELIPGSVEGDVPRHVYHPTMYISDTQHNRVLQVVFDNTRTAQEQLGGVVTEVRTGLADPWSNVCDDGKVYVAERLADRILAIDIDTGEETVLLQGNSILATGTPGVKQSLAPGVTLEQARAEPVLRPEGLAVLDGWLYYGCAVLQQIRRVNIATGEWEVWIDDAPSDGNTNFYKLGISDGTLLPRGSVLLSTWSTHLSGMPYIFLPDKTQLLIHSTSSDGPTQGVGALSGLDYGSAAGIGFGRLVYGASQQGLMQITRRLPSDVQVDTDLYAQGRESWRARGLDISHGYGGWGHYGLPMPDEISVAEQYYLDVNA